MWNQAENVIPNLIGAEGVPWGESIRNNRLWMPAFPERERLRAAGMTLDIMFSHSLFIRGYVLE